MNYKQANTSCPQHELFSEIILFFLKFHETRALCLITPQDLKQCLAHCSSTLWLPSPLHYCNYSFEITNDHHAAKSERQPIFHSVPWVNSLKMNQISLPCLTHFSGHPCLQNKKLSSMVYMSCKTGPFNFICQSLFQCYWPVSFLDHAKLSALGPLHLLFFLPGILLSEFLI